MDGVASELTWIIFVWNIYMSMLKSTHQFTDHVKEEILPFLPFKKTERYEITDKCNNHFWDMFTYAG